MKKLRPKDVASLMEETIQLYTDGKIKAPNPLKIVDYSHLEESFRALQSGKGMGKFVLVPTKDAVVPVVPSPLKPIRLEEHASYVLSGGLGIVGRSLALWMASVGARNLIFLSRSGDTSPDAKKVIQDLQSQGVRTGVFICDVSDKSSLETVTQRCQATFPPIKGCIQGAMVLRDKLFENMTHEDYLTTIKPKVQGSWNLHTCLPKDMDFFILLSSLNALLGSRAQANYAAGNTYQDALAAHRISIGLPATSLNLGALLANDHGVDDLQRFEKIQKLASILRHVHEGELHRVIEYCMDPDNLSIRPTQVALGLSTANQYLTQGVPLPLWMQWPLFSQLSSTRSAAAGPIGDEDADAKINIASHLGSMTSMGDTLVVITDAIRSKLSKLLSIPLENIDPTKSVSSHGVDSLVATEFRTWLSRILGADIPLLEILGTIPIAGASGLSMKAAFLSKLVPESIKTDVKMPE